MTTGHLPNSINISYDFHGMVGGWEERETKAKIGRKAHLVLLRVGILKFRENINRDKILQIQCITLSFWKTYHYRNQRESKHLTSLLPGSQEKEVHDLGLANQFLPMSRIMRKWYKLSGWQRFYKAIVTWVKSIAASGQQLSTSSNANGYVLSCLVSVFCFFFFWVWFFRLVIDYSKCTPNKYYF